MFEITAPLQNDLIPKTLRVEAITRFQIPSFHIVGLASQEVHEARERVRSAIESSGFEFPRRKIILNLSPAGVKKHGSSLDLAMAISILQIIRPVKKTGLIMASGELGLDGRIKSGLQVLRSLYSAWMAGAVVLVLATEDRNQARIALRAFRGTRMFQGPPPRLVYADQLSVAWTGLQEDVPQDPEPELDSQFTIEADPDHLTLLPLPPHIERICCASAAGRHHLLLLGPKGTGKTTALEWRSVLEPDADAEVLIEQSLFDEARGLHSETLLKNRSIIRKLGTLARPSALIGSVGPDGIRPGEFTLAHGGLLVADELPEWSSDSREILRGPLEQGKIILNRTYQSAHLPADFTLAASGNLCRCGGIPVGLQTQKNQPLCVCSIPQRRQYLSRLSGPVLDRIDLCVLVLQKSINPSNPSFHFHERHSRLRDGIAEARAFSQKILGAPAAKISAASLEDYLKDHLPVREALERIPFHSPRSRHKTLRVALTLAFLDAQALPREEHLREAALFRPEKVYGM